MTSFNDLPNELLLAIGDQFRYPKDVSKLRLVNSRLADTLRPVTFREARFDMSPSFVLSVRWKLQALVDGSSPACTLARILHVGSFPGQKYLARPPWVVDRSPYPTLEEYNVLIAEIQSLLPAGITALRGLECVSWSSDLNTGPQSLRDDINNILSRRSISSLSIVAQRFYPPPSTYNFRNLLRASFLVVLPQSIPLGPFQIQPDSEIRRLLKNASGLLSLTISDIQTQPSDYRQLDEIVPNDTADSPLSLQSLSLLSSGCSLNAPIGRTLANLKILHLPSPTSSGALSGETLKGQEEFWKQWNKFAVGIRLEEIVIDHIPPPALIEYLTSYSGLHTLQITGSVTGHVDIDPYIFWTDVLTKHAATLRVLHVNDNRTRNLLYEGTTKGILACTALRRIATAVRLPIPFDPQFQNVSNTLRCCLTPMLEEFPQGLPSLQELIIYLPAINTGRYTIEQVAYKEWIRSQTEGIVERSLRQSRARRSMFLHRVKVADSRFLALECFFEESKDGVDGDVGEQLAGLETSLALPAIETA